MVFAEGGSSRKHESRVAVALPGLGEKLDFLAEGQLAAFAEVDGSII